MSRFEAFPCSGPPANPWAAVAEACDRLTELRVAVGSHRQCNNTAMQRKPPRNPQRNKPTERIRGIKLILEIT